MLYVGTICKVLVLFVMSHNQVQLDYVAQAGIHCSCKQTATAHHLQRPRTGQHAANAHMMMMTGPCLVLLH
jgi:hypothetical protein